MSAFQGNKILTGRYATDTYYDKKLNALIETYQLTEYDQEKKKPVVTNLAEEKNLRLIRKQSKNS